MHRPTLLRRFLALAVASLALVLASARAESRPASVGPYAEAGMGATFFLPSAGQYSRVGPGLEIRAGRDLRSWLSVGLHLSSSTHEARLPPPPEGEYYQLHGVLAEVRLGVRVRMVSLFVDGGAGLGIVSSNILERVGLLEPGERYSLALRAGGGMEYQLQNRHFALGLGAQTAAWPGFGQLMGVSTRLYLRYTY